MKLTGLLTIVGLAFMSIVLSAEAQSTPEPNVCTPSVTTISDTNIGISWDEDCFPPQDILFDIELVDTGCKLVDYECTGYPCLMETNYMSCSPGTIKACTDVNFKITGKPSEESTALEITSAPWIKPSEWHLDQSKITDGILYANWGPANDPESEFVKCANKALVTASCSVDGVDISHDPIYLQPPAQGNATLDLTSDVCNSGEYILTVTYLWELIPTESKGTTTLEEKGTSTTTDSETIPSVGTTVSSTHSSSTGEGGDNEPDLTWWEILLIVIGVIVGCVLIAFAIYCIVKKKYCFKDC